MRRVLLRRHVFAGVPVIGGQAQSSATSRAASRQSPTRHTSGWSSFVEDVGMPGAGVDEFSWAASIAPPTLPARPCRSWSSGHCRRDCRNRRERRLTTMTRMMTRTRRVTAPTNREYGLLPAGRPVGNSAYRANEVLGCRARRTTQPKRQSAPALGQPTDSDFRTPEVDPLSRRP